MSSPDFLDTSVAHTVIIHDFCSNEETSSPELRATLAMCRHCFDVIIQRLGDSSTRRQPLPHVSSPEFIQDLHDPTVSCPLFVTWDKRRSNSNNNNKNNPQQSTAPPKFELRGCIGSLAPKPLVPAIGEYALLSAFGDRRFPPIQTHELQHLRVAVSLLIQYEPCQHVLDWLVGTHGIVIRWQHGGREYSGTYLPEVAAEQTWDQSTTIASLIRKAGWTRPVTDALLQTIECTRYQSSKLRLTFEEYLAHVRAGGPDAYLQGIVGGHGSSSTTDHRTETRPNHCLIS